MAATQRRPHPTRPPSDAQDRRLYAWLAVAMAVAIGLPAAVAFGAADADWVQGVRAPRDGPSWVKGHHVLATSGSGEMVSVRVSLDAPDADTRRFVSTRRDQLSLIVQASVASQDGQDAVGSERIEQLSEGIHDRLNDYLSKHRLAPVREVVIEDLVIGRHAPTAGGVP